MRKIKADTKAKKNTAVRPGKGAILAICAAGMLLLVLVILIIAEGFSGKSIDIENNTSKKIEDIAIYFESDEDYVSEILLQGSIGAGETYSGSFDTVDMQGNETELMVSVTFEGGESIIINDGYFYGSFNGSIDGRFYEEDGETYLKLKAGVGLTNDADSTYCDTLMLLNLEEGDWDYAE